MAHNLDGLQRIFRFDFSTGNPVLVNTGETVDLRSMEANGNLPDGTHSTSSSTFRLRGRAYVHNGATYLTFSHQGARGTFLGKLVFDDGAKLIVVGTISVQDRGNFLRPDVADFLLDQVEVPIVITKP